MLAYCVTRVIRSTLYQMYQKFENYIAKSFKENGVKLMSTRDSISQNTNTFDENLMSIANNDFLHYSEILRHPDSSPGDIHLATTQYMQSIV